MFLAKRYWHLRPSKSEVFNVDVGRKASWFILRLANQIAFYSIKSLHNILEEKNDFPIKRPRLSRSFWLLFENDRDYRDLLHIQLHCSQQISMKFNPFHSLNKMFFFQLRIFKIDINENNHLIESHLNSFWNLS